MKKPPIKLVFSTVSWLLQQLSLVAAEGRHACTVTQEVQVGLLAQVDLPIDPFVPFMPGGPLAPLGPGGPDVPLGPREPFTPMGPRLPIGPLSPLLPVSPIGPFGPLSPRFPFGPGGPGAPINEKFGYYKIIILEQQYLYQKHIYL
uniref:Uncharacterized protein n=1 Tax=Cyprinodon variegatus TaxID=28743 RepID=A0A3Q2DS06_CYPVA